MLQCNSYPQQRSAPVMIHLRSALRLMAMDSLLVICRLAPSMWPSSRITRSQCTYMPEVQVNYGMGLHWVFLRASG